ncbi:hypothetical protein M9458_057796, partial [Cirrhinus mrigala]
MWRKTKLEIHYSIYKDSLHAFNVELATARQKFFSNLINSNLNKTLFTTVERLTNPPSQIPSEMLSDSKCNDFASFSEKIINIRKKSYADDTQIYLVISPNDYSPIDSLFQCIDEINSWMCQNFLQLNKEKTEVIAFGSKEEVLKVNAYLDSRGQTIKNQVRNLGVILESDLSFSSHVKAVTKSAYYHLKNIARIRCFVSSQDLEKLVHAFITSRVDYCNGLLTGLPKKTIRQLQLIQNAAARILTRTRKSEHITPVL